MRAKNGTNACSQQQRSGRPRARAATHPGTRAVRCGNGSSARMGTCGNVRAGARARAAKGSNVRVQSRGGNGNARQRQAGARARRTATQRARAAGARARCGGGSTPPAWQHPATRGTAVRQQKTRGRQQRQRRNGIDTPTTTRARRTQPQRVGGNRVQNGPCTKEQRGGVPIGTMYSNMYATSNARTGRTTIDNMYWASNVQRQEHACTKGHRMYECTITRGTAGRQAGTTPRATAGNDHRTDRTTITAGNNRHQYWQYQQQQQRQHGNNWQQQQQLATTSSCK